MPKITVEIPFAPETKIGRMLNEAEGFEASYNENVVTLEALAFGQLCVHPAVYIRGDLLLVMNVYTVTHRLSGQALASFTTKPIAELAADAVKNFVDYDAMWTELEPLSADDRQKWFDEHPAIWKEIKAAKSALLSRPEHIADFDEFVDIYHGEDD